MSSSKQNQKFKFLEHPADIKLRVFGANLPELFINAALGMMTFLYGEKTIKAQKLVTNKKSIEISGDNLEMLLVNWLNEILFLSDIHNCVYVEYKIIEFIENKIVAKIGGYGAVAQDEIKAVTYHELSIKQVDDGWQAEVVFDI